MDFYFIILFSDALQSSLSRILSLLECFDYFYLFIFLDFLIYSEIYFIILFKDIVVILLQILPIMLKCFE